MLQVLGSLFVLLFGAIMAIAPRLTPGSADTAKVPPALFLIIGAVYLVFALIGLATALAYFALRGGPDTRL